MKSLPATECATRILVVDDEKPIRDLIAYTLGNAGYQVISASNGSEATDLARIMRFDLVIADMFTPAEDGIETLAELRVLAPEIRIIAMSGGTGDFPPLAKTLGRVAVLRKPFKLATFIATVETAVDPCQALTLGA